MGVDKSYHKAFENFKAAAEQSHSDAQTWLGY
jgi:TPR repeat protein